MNPTYISIFQHSPQIIHKYGERLEGLTDIVVMFDEGQTQILDIDFYFDYEDYPFVSSEFIQGSKTRQILEEIEDTIYGSFEIFGEKWLTYICPVV